MTPIARGFEELVAGAQACLACPAMAGQIRTLSTANGPADAEVLLIGEAPGRFGAGRSGVPFSGDESGRRLDRLIAAAGWTRADLFITNAVLCNPLDAHGRNRPPRQTELTNCRSWLATQIAVVDPFLVVALKSLARIAPHALSVRDSTATPIKWHGRHLAGVYHPGARAAVHRPVPEQLTDFERLGAWFSAESAARR